MHVLKYITSMFIFGRQIKYARFAINIRRYSEHWKHSKANVYLQWLSYKLRDIIVVVTIYLSEHSLPGDSYSCDNLYKITVL